MNRAGAKSRIHLVAFAKTAIETLLPIHQRHQMNSAPVKRDAVMSQAWGHTYDLCLELILSFRSDVVTGEGNVVSAYAERHLGSSLEFSRRP